MEEKQMICPICGYIGQKERFSKGSYILEMFLWCLLFVPGALYTTWRSFNEYHACPKCKNETMTPLDSPLGKRIKTEKERMQQPIDARDLFNTLSKLLRS